MGKKNSMKPVALAISAAFAGTMGMSGMVSADASPFSMTNLTTGYMADVAEKKGEEGKCGEGKCGEKKGEEGKCGEGKCGEKKGEEGKCGGDKDKDKGEEGKCGGHG
jgi:uncharacterized low-complexity protein